MSIWESGASLKIGDVVTAPYKKCTWVDRWLWRLFRYDLKRKTDMRQYKVVATYSSEPVNNQ